MLTQFAKELIIPKETEEIIVEIANDSTLGNVSEYSRERTIVLRENSSLVYIRLQNTHSILAIDDKKTFMLKNGSHLSFFNATFGEHNESLSIESNIEGSNAQSNLSFIYYASGSQNISQKVANNFLNKNSRGVITIKGIGDDESKVRVDGMIRIAESGHGTEAHLEEHTLLLSKKARIENIPALEIGTNDVKARHAATTSRIDNEQLFYLVSRGISEEKGRRMIIEGFLKDPIENIKDQKSKQSIIKALHNALTRSRKLVIQ